jgi:hypothetical protein
MGDLPGNRDDFLKIGVPVHRSGVDRPLHAYFKRDATGSCDSREGQSILFDEFSVCGSQRLEC